MSILLFIEVNKMIEIKTNSELIKEVGSGKTGLIFLNKVKLNKIALLIYDFLLIKNKQGEVIVNTGVSTLARMFSCSKNSIKRAFEELEKLELVKVTSKGLEGKQLELLESRH